MTASPAIGSSWQWLSWRESQRAAPLACEGEAEVLREETGMRPAAARRGTGPRTSTQSGERPSGRASAQQGARGTLHRLPDPAIVQRPGQGWPGGTPHETRCSMPVGHGAAGERCSTPDVCGVSVRVRLRLQASGKAALRDNPHIPGCHPDSGTPTGREEGGLRKRGLWGNEAPTSPIERARVGHSPPKVIRAAFLPDGDGVQRRLALPLPAAPDARRSGQRRDKPAPW